MPVKKRLVIKIFDFAPDTAKTNLKHLPFPKEGDIIMVGDSIAKVTSCELNPETKKESLEDDESDRRYATIVLRVKI